MKTPNEIVEEVLQNKWGTGETRKQKLKEAGYSWIEIQSLVNLKYGGRPIVASVDEVAKEVIEGRWGDENERAGRLTAAGQNPTIIQSRVKQLAQGNFESNTTVSVTPNYGSDVVVGANVTAKGIDISAWQGIVDFNQVKSDGIDFVILREGFGTSIDSCFLNYTNGAKKAGLPIHGVYHFCYSTNENEVLAEARSCLANVQKAGLPKSTIIFFDFEYDTVKKAQNRGKVLGKNECISFSDTFCQQIVKAGYKAGIYSNLDYYNNYYDQAIINKYIYWVAQYNNGGTPLRKGAYHQWTDEGRVKGINGNVDLDYCYIVNPATAKTTEAVETTVSGGSTYIKPTTSNSTVAQPAQVQTITTDFTKYNGKISNCGKDEYGGISGGSAGDQSGKEWWIINWYSQGWQCVLRHPDQKVREYIAELGIEAAENNNVGYDQSQNRTYWEQLQAVGYWPKKITVRCEADCSAGVTSNVKAVGYLLNMQALKDVDITYTGAMRAELRAAGFQVLTDRKYLTSSDYLLPGDIILNDAQHTATSVGYGKYTRGQASSHQSEAAAAGDKGVVNVDALNFRQGPGTGYALVPKYSPLTQGTEITILGVEQASSGADWYKISYNGVEGYVAAKYIGKV